MTLLSRIAALERSMPPPPGDPSDGYTDEELIAAVRDGPGRMSLGFVLPDPPLPPDLSEALRRFTRATFFDDFRVCGYSPRMFQQALRNTARECGVPLRTLLAHEVAYGSDDDPPVGVYTPWGAVEARQRQQREQQRQQDAAAGRTP